MRVLDPPVVRGDGGCVTDGPPTTCRPPRMARVAPGRGVIPSDFSPRAEGARQLVAAAALHRRNPEERQTSLNATGQGTDACAADIRMSWLARWDLTRATPGMVAPPGFTACSASG